MTNVGGGASEVAQRDDDEFEVAVPASPTGETEVMPASAPDHTRRIPLLDEEPRPITPMPGDDAAAPVAPPPSRTSRTARFGAALFWMAAGWWLFAVVRWGTEVARASNVDGVWRQVPTATLTDAARDATDRAPSELIALVALSVIATLVLLISRGRRWLGVPGLGLAAAAVVVAWWHLGP